MYGFKDGVQFEKLLDYHVCTDEDYAEFNQISEGSLKFYNEIRDDEKRGFLCLNWDDVDPYLLRGTS